MTDEVIKIQTYDPCNSIFKSSSSDKEYVNIFYCNKKDTCKAYQSGKCVQPKPSVSGFESCPYGHYKRLTGFTKRARNCGKLVDQYKTKYANLKPLKPLNCLCEINDYIYLGLPLLETFVNSVGIPLYKNKKMIKKEDFNVENLIKIVDYIPRDAMAYREIKDYQERIPFFLLLVEEQFPRLFAELIERRPDVIEKRKLATHKGRTAYVKTLKPGKVKMKDDVFTWDGIELSCPINTIYAGGKFTDEICRVVPNDNVLVTIIDETTVTADTRFD